MKHVVNETVKTAIGFLNAVKPGDKVTIIHAHDNDSICSAAIIYKLLKRFHNIEAKLVVSDSNSSVTESTLTPIGKLKPNHIIIVDIAEINVNVLTRLRNIARVMVVDHHIPRGYVKISYVNPRIYDRDAYTPATYICYKIYENFLDPKEILWIAGIGTLSDMGMKNCPDLFDAISHYSKELVGDNGSTDEILFDRSVLGKLAKMFNSARIVGGVKGSIIALDALIGTNDYREVLSGKSGVSRRLLDWHNLAEKEFGRLVKAFERQKKVVGSLVLYEVKSRYNMKSSLATYLSRRMKNNVVVIYQKSGRFVDSSFRRGDACGVDLVRLSEMSVMKIPNTNAGGHIQASGAKFPSKYMNSWIKNLKEAFSRVKKS